MDPTISPESGERSLTQTLGALQQFIEVVAKLRSPNGCPWDRAQTPLTLTPFIIEEAYETVAAIRSEDTEHIREELGDLLLQVVLQAQIFSEVGEFSLREITEGITEKMIRRHPHVFGAEAGEIEVAEVKQNWEAIKSQEKAEETLADKLMTYAETFPPLLAASKITKTAKRKQLLPTMDLLEQLGDVEQQVQRLRQVLLMAPEQGEKNPEQGEKNNDESANEQEMGDRPEDILGQTLLSLAQLAKCNGLDAAAALDAANRNAAQRLAHQVDSEPYSSNS